MNKKDTAIVVFLFGLLVVWFVFLSPKMPAKPVQSPEAAADGTEAAGMPDEAPSPLPEMRSNATAVVEAPVAPQPTVSPEPEPEPEVAPEPEIVHTLEEKTEELSNSNVLVTVSSWGGCIKSAQLLEYRETLDEDSDDVLLDFADRPALGITGDRGFSTATDFDVVEATDTNVVLERVNGSVKLRRSITLGEGYDLSVVDEFTSLDGKSVPVPAQFVDAGQMTKVQTKSAVRGATYISIDSLPMHKDADVIHWSKTKQQVDGQEPGKLRLAQRFQPVGRQGGCAAFRPKLGKMLPRELGLQLKTPTQWVAVKNKFFISVLTPEEGCQGLELGVERFSPDLEDEANPASWVRNPVIAAVSARLSFDAAVIPEGGAYTRKYSYYVGPKKYTELKKLGKSYGEIMQFGFWSPLSRILLVTLNGIHALIGNYGVAIILLTIIVRLLFWPVTHKSTESMRRMQELQPEIKKLQAKYKDSPEKLNKATMAFYKENKLNPMAGCLPLVIQIPVFFALFTVLRSAVELRFAEFLWIRDLSEQEGLLPGLPIIGCLNILPIVMTVLTLFQQRLTPTAGDSQQQKMMMFMPVMFLFLFYPMPSALVLYWTTSQLIALVQLILQRRKRAAESGGLKPAKA